MSEPNDLDDLRERLSSSPFHAGLGIEAVEASEGRVRLALEASEDQRNLLGTVHGGIVASLADTAMGLAVRTAIEPGRPHVTIEMSVRYLRPAAPGRIEAVGTVIRTGSQIAFAEAEVLADGAAVARASGTYAVGAR